MGILLSIIRFLSGEDSEVDQSQRCLSSRRGYDTVPLSYYTSSSNYCSNAGQDIHYVPRRNSTVAPSPERNDVFSCQTKYLTLTVPNVRKHPSHAQTSVNAKVKGSAAPVFVKETTPQNDSRMGRFGIGSSSNISRKFEGNERKEGEMMFKFVVAPPVSEGRWIKHYSSCHRILLVGEGDFSFSTCLAAAFGWASNMIATSLDSQDFLTQNYHNALSNIVELSIRSCKVMHEIDATTMANHAILGYMKFDRIIFNFPFAGFFKNLSREAQLRLHRRLVSLFLKNAKEMICENGEIHISHKTNGFHGEWKLEAVASSYRLRLIEAVDFNHLDYPGYNTKCGFGGDNNFNCYPSKTFKFRLKC